MIPERPVSLNDCPLAHLAIAVTSLDESEKLYAAMDFTLHARETVEREQVRISLVSQGELRIELLEPIKAGEGPIGRFLAKRGPGLHHVALLCKNLEERLSLLEKSRVRPLPGYPASGAGKSRVAFLDPKTTGGVLFELVQLNAE